MLPTLPLREAQRSATSLVRSLLSQHPHLSTGELFKLGTADERPSLQPDHAVTPEGKLRMKRVSNIREGSRIWVPPPTAPYPGHPFRSVHYFKKNILHQLQAMGLIRMVVIHTPMTDEAERAEAIRKADIYTLRRERAALKAANKKQVKKPLKEVEPVEPIFTNKSYAWVLHDSAIADERQPSAQVLPPPDVSVAWERAEALEAKRLGIEAEEAEAIEARRAARKARYRAETDAYRVERQRLQDAGMWETFLANKARQERRRMAIDTVRKYAELTGEDVSRWFEELGVKDPSRSSMFGLQRDFTQEESDDLQAEVYRQEQAALLEREREAERNRSRSGSVKVQRTEDTPFGLRSDTSEQLNTILAEEVLDEKRQRADEAKLAKPSFPVDMAWQEQLAARIRPGSDSPFLLKRGHEALPPYGVTASPDSVDRQAAYPLKTPHTQRLAAIGSPRHAGVEEDRRERDRTQEKLNWSRSLPAAALRSSHRSNESRSRSFGLK